MVNVHGVCFLPAQERSYPSHSAKSLQDLIFKYIEKRQGCSTPRRTAQSSVFLDLIAASHTHRRETAANSAFAWWGCISFPERLTFMRLQTSRLGTGGELYLHMSPTGHGGFAVGPQAGPPVAHLCELHGVVSGSDAATWCQGDS